MAGGAAVNAVAARASADPATLWRLCRRYEQVGLRSVVCLAQPRQEGMCPVA
jgi:hypothetical protein